MSTCGGSTSASALPSLALISSPGFLGANFDAGAVDLSTGSIGFLDGGGCKDGKAREGGAPVGDGGPDVKISAGVAGIGREDPLPPPAPPIAAGVQGTGRLELVMAAGVAGLPRPAGVREPDLLVIKAGVCGSAPRFPVIKAGVCGGISAAGVFGTAMLR